MDVVGYALIDRDAKTGVSAIPIENFTKNRVRVLEFGSDGCVMVLDDKASGIATFDKCDIRASFRCTRQGDVICPPNQNQMETFLYFSGCMNRTGGYNHIVAEMVIAASLHKGEFNDNVLWAINPQENPRKR